MMIDKINMFDKNNTFLRKRRNAVILFPTDVDYLVDYINEDDNNTYPRKPN